MKPALALATLLSSLAASPACERAGSPAPQAGSPTGPKSKAATDADHPARTALLALNQKRYASAVEVFAPDAELMLIDSTQDPLRGRAQIQAQLERWSLTFPDLRAEPVRILDSGQMWLVEIFLSGTQLGEFHGQPVSQRRVASQVALLAKVEAGRIHKAWLCGNPLAVIKQIQAPEGDRRWLPPAPVGAELRRESGPAAQLATVRAFFQTFATGDLAALSSQVTDDVVVYAYGDGRRLEGIEALRLTLVREREAFEGQIQVEQAVTVGPYVAVLVQIHGTLKADVGPLKATGRHFAERGIDLFRFEGGKIQEWDNYRNLLDLMRQLGLWPPPAP